MVSVKSEGLILRGQTNGDSFSLQSCDVDMPGKQMTCGDKTFNATCNEDTEICQINTNSSQSTFEYNPVSKQSVFMADVPAASTIETFTPSAEGTTTVPTGPFIANVTFKNAYSLNGGNGTTVNNLYKRFANANEYEGWKRGFADNIAGVTFYQMTTPADTATTSVDLKFDTPEELKDFVNLKQSFILRTAGGAAPVSYAVAKELVTDQVAKGTGARNTSDVTLTYVRNTASGRRVETVAVKNWADMEAYLLSIDEEAVKMADSSYDTKYATNHSYEVAFRLLYGFDGTYTETGKYHEAALNEMKNSLPTEAQADFANVEIPSSSPASDSYYLEGEFRFYPWQQYVGVGAGLGLGTVQGPNESIYAGRLFAGIASDLKIPLWAGLAFKPYANLVGTYMSGESALVQKYNNPDEISATSLGYEIGADICLFAYGDWCFGPGVNYSATMLGEASPERFNLSPFGSEYWTFTIGAFKKSEGTSEDTRTVEKSPKTDLVKTEEQFETSVVRLVLPPKYTPVAAEGFDIAPIKADSTFETNKSDLKKETKASDVAETTLFPGDNADRKVNPGAYKAANEIWAKLEYLKTIGITSGSFDIAVEAAADSAGKTKYNLDLSVKRGRSFKDELISELKIRKAIAEKAEKRTGCSGDTCTWQPDDVAPGEGQTKVVEKDTIKVGRLTLKFTSTGVGELKPVVVKTKEKPFFIPYGKDDSDKIYEPIKNARERFPVEDWKEREEVSVDPKLNKDIGFVKCFFLTKAPSEKGDKAEVKYTNDRGDALEYKDVKDDGYCVIHVKEANPSYDPKVKGSKKTITVPRIEDPAASRRVEIEADLSKNPAFAGTEAASPVYEDSTVGGNRIYALDFASGIKTSGVPIQEPDVANILGLLKVANVQRGEEIVVAINLPSSAADDVSDRIAKYVGSAVMFKAPKNTKVRVLVNKGADITQPGLTLTVGKKIDENDVATRRRWHRQGTGATLEDKAPSAEAQPTQEATSAQTTVIEQPAEQPKSDQAEPKAEGTAAIEQPASTDEAPSTDSKTEPKQDDKKSTTTDPLQDMIDGQ